MNIQQIYDTLYAKQQELVSICDSHYQRGMPTFQTEALAIQVANLNGAVGLLLKALGAKTHE